MPSLKLSFLGRVNIEQDGKPVHLKTRKTIALLAYLAVTGQIHRRASLHALLWPEADAQRAANSLRRALANLKQGLQSQWLAIERHTVGLKLSPDVELDVAHFYALTASAQSKQTVDPLLEAVSYYHNDFLAGFTLPDAPAFDEWQFFERERARQTVVNALEKIIDHDAASQRYDSAIQHARRWVTLDSLHEPAQRQLIQLFVQAGQQTNARRQYDTYATELYKELGVRPNFELSTLAQQYRPIPTAPPPVTKQSRLPVELTTFVGRQQAITEVATMLTNPAHRLITLVGSGGIGKTRLALQVGRQQEKMNADGVYYVDLAPLRMPSLVTEQIADALGVSLNNTSTPPQQLANYLADKSMLLLLDNFEHLLDGVDIIEILLSQAPQLKMIITSREPLNLIAEWLYPVHGLPFPQNTQDRNNSSLETATQYGAVQLFSQRARQVNPTFSVADELPHIIHICQLVEGLPLGIELAAAWVRTLTCADIAQEIAHNLDFLTSIQRRANKRHQSIRAVFEHSWQLLSKAEQQLLAQLSLWAGHFTREAIQAVTGHSLFTIHGLVNKSLLQHYRQSNRYRLHERLRQFAAEKLAQMMPFKGETEKQYAHYYGTFLQQREYLWENESQGDVLKAVRLDIQNIRLGWRWAAAHQETTILDLYINSLLDFYMISNAYHEGEEAFNTAVSQLKGTATLPASTAVFQLKDTAERTPQKGIVLAKMMARQALFCQNLGRFQQALTLAQESLAILQDSQLSREIAFVHNVLGRIYQHQGHYVQAKHHLQNSFEHLQKTNYPNGIANTALHLGDAVFNLGDYAEAQYWYQISRDTYKTIKKTWGLAQTTQRLGMIAEAVGDFDKATHYFSQSLARFEEIDSPHGMVKCLNHLGALAQKEKDMPQAQQWYIQSRALCQQHQLQVELARTLNHLADIACFMENYDEAKAHLKAAATIVQTIKAPPLILQTLLGVATWLQQTTPPLMLEIVNESESAYNKMSYMYSLFTFVAEHPATHRMMGEVAQQRLAALTKRLPPHIIEQLQQDKGERQFNLAEPFNLVGSFNLTEPFNLTTSIPQTLGE